MGTLTAGQVVIVHFPFSDLTASKLRPAAMGFSDLIVIGNALRLLRWRRLSFNYLSPVS
jgi:cation transport ATPase